MKINRFFLSFLMVLSLGHLSSTLQAAPENETAYKEKSSGWSLGTDQGVMFFVGRNSQYVNPQYYGTVYGGYNLKGIFMPMLRIGQGYGSLSGYGNPSSFWLMTEGGFRVTPLRTKFRPFFMGTAGFYLLNFTDLGTPVEGGVNFTFSGGGGLEVLFGGSALTLGASYHGFSNAGPYLEAVSATLGYRYQF